VTFYLASDTIAFTLSALNFFLYNLTNAAFIHLILTGFAEIERLKPPSLS